MEKIIPHWHTDVKSVVLRPELEHIRPTASNNIIVKNVDIHLLIRNLTCGNAEPLIQPHSDKSRLKPTKIDQILCHWKLKTKLLPPTIFHVAGQGWILSDGFHRIYVTLHLANVTHLPVIVSINDISRLEKLLCSNDPVISRA